MKRNAYMRLLSLGLAGLIGLTACSQGGEKTSTESASGEASSQVASSEPASQGVNIKDALKEGVTEAGTPVQGEDGKTYMKKSGSFFDVFDTVISLTTYTEKEEDFDRYFQMTHEEFTRLHQLYDNYHEYEGVKNVMTINQAAGKEAVSVDPDLYDLIQFSLEAYPKSHNKVNIAMGSVLELWHKEREAADIYSGDELQEKAPGEGRVEGKAPDPEALKQAGQHMDIQKVKLNPDDHSVYLEDPEMSLDLGAVAKGYATELVARKLEAAGLKSGIISAGGNVRLIGSPVDGRESWTVGVTDPRHEQASGLCAVPAQAGDSVVTSGDSERYYYVDGKKMHHIIDPRTLWPETHFPSVTILTQDSGLADFLSTALFLSDKEEAAEILKNFPDHDIQVIWIDKDNQVTFTAGLEGKILQ